MEKPSCKAEASAVRSPAVSSLRGSHVILVHVDSNEVGDLGPLELESGVGINEFKGLR